MSTPVNPPGPLDPSRVEAAEAGVHHEIAEAETTGRTEDHVVAEDAVPTGPADPYNPGLVVATPAASGGLLATALVALATVIGAALVALAIVRA